MKLIVRFSGALGLAGVGTGVSVGGGGVSVSVGIIVAVTVAVGTGDGVAVGGMDSARGAQALKNRVSMSRVVIIFWLGFMGSLPLVFSHAKVLTFAWLFI